MPVTVVVTRPGEAGQALAEELRHDGQPAEWLPAFEFGAAPDEPQARAVLARLADFDLAIFVSPQAARATAGLMSQPWPVGTAIAAVGAGTRSAVLDSIPGASATTVLAPSGDEEAGGSGSESLWPLLQAMQPAPRRVLLLRAEHGRDWLTGRLQQAGATVTPLAVYSRRAHVPSAQARARLAVAAANGLACVITSSDAVDALSDMLGSLPDVLAALRRGVVLASHPRIAERLRAAGFARVAACPPKSAAVLAALRGGGG